MADGRSAAKDRSTALLRATVKPGAPVSYLAHYSMNLSTDAVARRIHGEGGGQDGRFLMRVLVVYCHPVPESFCAAVRDAAVETLTARGWDVRLVDLYAEGFDPVMSADERRNYNDRAPTDPTLAPHIENLKWAEAVLSSIRPGGTGCRRC